MNTVTGHPIPASVVADHMAKEPIVIRADASLTDAAALMDRQHIHGLPVVDHNGTLVGVLSQTDLNRARSTEYLWVNWPGLAVRHLMTSPAITIHRSTPLITGHTVSGGAAMSIVSSNCGLPPVIDTPRRGAPPAATSPSPAGRSFRAARFRGP